TIKTYQCDTTKPARSTEVVAQAVKDFGKLDVVVEAVDTEEETVDWTLGVNVKGVFFLCQAAAKYWITAKQPGSIVINSSMSANIINTPQRQAIYNASKAAATSLAKAFAFEWASHNIRVNAVSPGYVATEMTAMGNPDMQKVWLAQIQGSPVQERTPMGRMANPEEIGKSIAFVASELSSYTTGSQLVVDGGYSQLSARKQVIRRDVPEAGFDDPRANGGTLLTSGFLTFPAGLGEPLNVILSAKSDPAVLVDQEDRGGLRNYFLSMDFSGECLGQHLGSDQQANLGDGKGAVNETAVMRYNFKDAYVGTCRETVEGGNHFRYWTQKTTGAVFMAASVELPIEQGHDIVRNGYNLGRDWIVGNLTGASSPIVSFNFPPDIPPSNAIPDSVEQLSSSSVAATNTVPPTSFVPNITFPLSTIVPTDTASTPLVVALSDSLLTDSANATVTVPIAIPTASLSFTTTTTAAPTQTNPTYVGQTRNGGYVYETTATYVSGLLSNSSDGVNHPITVEQNGRPAQDGLVAVLEVKIVSRPEGSGARLNMPIPTVLVAIIAGLLSLPFL
ncbi:hypothetical protein FRC07_006506, partial [Ceratobasidium sp. 392]